MDVQITQELSSSITEQITENTPPTSDSSVTASDSEAPLIELVAEMELTPNAKISTRAVSTLFSLNLFRDIRWTMYSDLITRCSDLRI